MKGRGRRKKNSCCWKPSSTPKPTSPVGTVYCWGGIFPFFILFQLFLSLTVSLSVVVPCASPEFAHHPIQTGLKFKGQLRPSLTDRREEAASATALDRTAGPSFLSPPCVRSLRLQTWSKTKRSPCSGSGGDGEQEELHTNELGSWLRRGRKKSRGTKGC
ncbi:hypothetical protein B0T10DRAFT_577878 [Thelonectria olida]|uniref:Uncharacterized protein n=1 Tax=Thelonectria olida TaxID=1576542 RepID=A0A9P9AVJ5_9HYPO|nr:hypothetical protein B0T10DRAFT_577878 [Thelonectria olida]